MGSCGPTGPRFWVSSERPFETKFRYVGFVDASSARHDSFSLAIAHRDGERVVLDAVREWRAPFDPVSVVDQAAAILRTYRLNSVIADAYAAGFVEGQFKQHGVSYRAADKDKSTLFLECLAQFTSASVLLLDEPRLVTQLTLLQREVGKAGRDRIVKQRGGFDDLANSACGAIVYARNRPDNSPRITQTRAIMSKNSPRSKDPIGPYSSELVRSVLSAPRDVTSTEFELNRLERIGSYTPRQSCAIRGRR